MFLKCLKLIRKANYFLLFYLKQSGDFDRPYAC